MADRIEEAVSGRASCRKCKGKIEKGQLRFGEVDFTFSESGTYKWYHLPCAADRVPDKLRGALEAWEGEVPDREALEAALAKGKKGKVAPRGELAPSGRASCLGCGEKIKKDELRLVVEREVDTGAFTAKRPGYLHLACAKGSEHLAGEADLTTALRENSDLEPAKLEELLAALA
ncbi:MAG: hypothetical protein AB7N76_14300 [Planctomycetota bacterium]